MISAENRNMVDWYVVTGGKTRAENLVLLQDKVFIFI